MRKASRSIALVGNPNCGKTTLFNALTGSNQSVGNWPGVTVEKKEGRLRGAPDVTLLDLPGIYSLSPFSPEEIITRDVLLRQRPEAVLNLVDGTNLERNLYLTTQLLELGIPMLVAVNFMDVLEKRGDLLRLETLSKALGCPVVRISALRGLGVPQLLRRLPALAAQPPPKPWSRFSAVAEGELAALEARLPRHVPSRLRRFTAIKLYERDPIAAREHPGIFPENREGDSVIAGGRYDQIGVLARRCLQKNQRPEPSQRIDRLLTNPVLALPIFAFFMLLVYYISVSTLGAWLSHAVGQSLSGLSLWLERLFAQWALSPWLSALLLDGLLAGMSAVLGFVPQMLLLFFCLAFLEGCGYLARIAFLLDRLFRRFGLSGRSFMPLLLATGCGVPGILATRTIENERERRVAMISCTFLPCSAKLPIIALIAGALFGGAWWVAPSVYFAGISAVLVSGALLRKLRVFPRDDAPFVLELPPYRLPPLRHLARGVWEHSLSFLKKAGTVILLSSMLVWFLSSAAWKDGELTLTGTLSEGLLARAGRSAAWLFAPLGFGGWQAVAATATAFLAKENAVSTLGILYGFSHEGGAAELWHGFREAFTPLSGYSFLLFNLLCAPCVAAVSALRREMASLRWTLFALGYQTAFAYGASFLVYQFGCFFVLRQGFTVYTLLALALLLAVAWLLLGGGRRSRS